MIEYALSPQPQPPLWQRATLKVGVRAGWTINISVEVPARCVLVGAHHTSTTDVLAAWLLMGAGVDMRWVAKSEAFRWPTRRLFTALGGLPVQRGGGGFVNQMVKEFERREELRLAICPEGTRTAQKFWKTGFYHIAQGARVPILLGYADYPRKEVGIGASFMPSGDMERDFAIMRRFYEDKRGRFPAQESEVVAPPVEAATLLPAD